MDDALWGQSRAMPARGRGWSAPVDMRDWGAFAHERGAIAGSEARFATSDALRQRIFDAAQEKIIGNLRDFGGRAVLVDGGGYNHMWLGAQPMGGEMYAKQNVEAALNNQLLFMEFARQDGRIPGSIRRVGGLPQPQFDKMQGFCFPQPALNMYWWIGQDNRYLRFLADTLLRFDAYLWDRRDSNADGCLESWCSSDTCEANALRYGDAPEAWGSELPPRASQSVPMASMGMMSYSFAIRAALAKVFAILGEDGRAAAWRVKAGSVRKRMRELLWDEARGACFDRDSGGRKLYTLDHNNLRCMYMGSFTKDMASRFVERHLLNAEEFWTPMPLPTVAANDKLFRNKADKDWSGMPQGLTYQRAIRALDNYGYARLLPRLADRLFLAIGERGQFVKQYDTYTGRPSGGRNGYGPTVLAALEYIARLHGVHIEDGELHWGALGGANSEYSQFWRGREYAMACKDGRAAGFIDGRRVFEADAGVRVVTGMDGESPRYEPLR